MLRVSLVAEDPVAMPPLSASAPVREESVHTSTSGRGSHIPSSPDPSIGRHARLRLRPQVCFADRRCQPVNLDGGEGRDARGPKQDDLLRRVPVPDALVTSIEELVVGYVVLTDVLLHLLEGPVGKRVDLDHAGILHVDDVEVASFAALASPSSGENCLDLQLRVRSICRFHLRPPVVALLVRLPQPLAVFRAEVVGRPASLWLVDVNGDIGISPANTLDERESLRKVVKRVEKDQVHIYGRRHAGDHVDGDKAGQSEGGCLVQRRE